MMRALLSGTLLEQAALAIEMVGALIIVGFLLAAVCALLRGKGIAHARLLTAEGVLYGLSFKLAASLLKTIQLHTWQQIGVFASILAIRTVVKLILNWERGRIRFDLLRQITTPTTHLKMRYR